MMNVEVAGQTYRVGRMSAMSQFHVGRRIAPMLFALGQAGVGMLGKEPQGGGDGLAAFVPLIAPIAEVLAKMTDDESEYVIGECLSVVAREAGDGRFQPVLSEERAARIALRLLFSDIDLRVMLRLVMESLRENLGDFWRGLGSEGAPESSGTATPPTSTP